MSGPGEADGVIVAPNVRAFGELADTLRDYLAGRMPHARNIALANFAYPRGAGQSHETILFDAEWREGDETRAQGMVVRIKPSSHTVFLDDMFTEQYELMRVMHERGAVAVAKPLWIEQDPDLLGAPFFIMEKRSGQVAVSIPPYSAQGWLFDASSAMQRRIWTNAVEQLAAIQRVPVSAAPFLAPAAGMTGFEQEINRWRRYLEWIGERHDLPFHRAALAQLMERLPGNRAEGIVWGDARLGNMMIGAAGEVVAVMDWEQPSLGGALHDLGWWLVNDWSMTTGKGLPRLPGSSSRDDMVAHWEDVSAKSAADVEWYEDFACFKMACLSTRMVELKGVSPGNGYGNNAMSRQLAQRLGMAEPAD